MVLSKIVMKFLGRFVGARGLEDCGAPGAQAASRDRRARHSEIREMNNGFLLFLFYSDFRRSLREDILYVVTRCPHAAPRRLKMFSRRTGRARRIVSSDLCACRGRHAERLRTYEAMDALDERQHEARIMPVPDELIELRRSVAAIFEPCLGPTQPGLAP